MNDLWSDVRSEMEALGEKIKRIRLAESWSQGELVKQLGVMVGWDVPTLSRIEAGVIIPNPEVGKTLTTWIQGHLQIPLPSLAVRTPTPARNTDPETSRINTPTSTSEIHALIAQILTQYPRGMTHDVIIHTYRTRAGYASGYPECSDQRLRTATKELVAAGKVEDTGERRLNERGRQCIVWGWIPQPLPEVDPAVEAYRAEEARADRNNRVWDFAGEARDTDIEGGNEWD